MKRTPFLVFFIGILLIHSFSVSAKVTIEHWHNSYASQVEDYLVAMQGEFEKANPNIKVDVPTVEGIEYANKLVTTTAAGVGPDIVEWWPGPTAFAVTGGMFEDLTPYVKRDNINLNEFIPAAIQSYMWGGILWGFPHTGYPIVTHYSQSAWDEAGLVNPYDQGESWTWDSVLSCGQKLTRQAASQDVPDMYGIQLRVRSMPRAEVFAYQAGGGFFDQPIGPTKSLFNSEPALTALTWISELAERGVIPRKEPSGTDLLNGKAATFIYNGPHQATGPEYQPVRGQLVTPIGLAPMPKGPVHNGTFFITDGWMMSSSSKNKEAAWRWLKYIATDASRSARLAQQTGRIPGMIKAIRTYLETLPQGLLHPHVIMDTVLAPTTRVGQAQHANISDIERAMQKEFMAVREGKQPPRTALDRLHDTATGLLK